MNKGVSLVILVLTIIIMSIIGGIVVINSSNMFRDKDVSKMQVDTAQLANLTRNYEIRKNGNLDFYVVSMDVSSCTTEELGQFAGENIIDGRIELYAIDLDKVDAEDANFGKQEYGMNDRYLYSATTHKVYYEKGIYDGDMTIYTND